MKREYPLHPVVAVSAIIFEGETVLVIKRAHAPGKDQWNLPGGVVKVGETLMEALNREIHEELSVEMEIGGFAGVADHILRDESGKVQYHYVIIDYWGWLHSGKVRAGSDAREIKFVRLDDLCGIGISREVREIISKAYNLRAIEISS